ncbi:MAG: hypothetical protein PHD04_05285 [Candidatus Pacebacteria bacterium]|nr:hypothetical protein [Candidatus Paceibacterota bacterium]
MEESSNITKKDKWAHLSPKEKEVRLLLKEMEKAFNEYSNKMSYSWERVNQLFRKEN